MYLLIGLVCLLFFLYNFHLLIKDDFILIRKNLLPEQLFDLVFIGTFLGLLFSKIISASIISNSISIFFKHLFELSWNGFTLTGFLIGCSISFYLLFKYRKLPLAHLFDLLTLSLLSAIPVGYFIALFFKQRFEIIYSLSLTIIYFIIQFLFWKILYPKIVNNKIKEGSLSAIFYITFSIISLISSQVSNFKGQPHIDVETIILFLMLAYSTIVLIRNEKKQAYTFKKK